MNAYTVNVEAMGYGQPEDEVAALTAALEEAELGDDVQWTVMADEQRGLLLVQLKLDGVSAVDVHELTMTVWQDAWDAAFSADHAPTTTLAIRCVPVNVEAPA